MLDDPELRAQWLVELTAMRDRINAVRQRIAAADPRLAFIGQQFGMFSMLPLSKEQVVVLRERHAIYMADSGRFNVVGMGDLVRQAARINSLTEIALTKLFLVARNALLAYLMVSADAGSVTCGGAVESRTDRPTVPLWGSSIFGSF